MRELMEARPAREGVRARDLPLDGMVAMVTGGGQGLGEQICAVLAEAGAAVAVADVDSARAMEVANRLHSAGAEAEFLPLDVTDAEACQAALRQLVETHGHLDVVINNAGIDVTKPIDEMSIDEFDRVLAVNLRAPFVLARAALPIMAARGRGHIVNVVSTASKRAWANASAYHASKWGLLGLSHALHVEARERGVKVTAVVAGGMRTPFILERFPDVDQGTLQDPRNVAETIRFVLSQPDETVIPEVMVLPMRETSWP
jgi:NAD(P)-dependent dehydrogenase (short-subunit alcohol dehydrogenase family)